jgi:DUF4097 and DUF4098 domain-containing protein YvlB
MLTALATLSLTGPMVAQDYHFTKEMAPGATLAIENINGKIEVTQGTGRTAEVSVTKTVKKGDGNLVKAIMETDGNTIRVCTLYLNRDKNRDSCKGENNDGPREGASLDVDMHYVVRVPAGVRFTAENVNGAVEARGLEAPASLETVNGDVIFEGSTASSIQTVNGKIRGTFTRGTWDGKMEIETVNGGVDLTFPATLSATITGETVNGGIHSDDFPITIEGKWGPKSFTGRIGGGTSKLSIQTVNGGITLQRTGRGG